MRRILAGLAGVLIMANGHALTINLDFSRDSSGFFDGNAVAKATLIKAAQDLSDALTAANAAPLAAVTTSSYSGTTGDATVTFDWSLKFNDPSDLSQVITLPSFSLMAGEFRIYAGASTALSGKETLGEGAPSSGDYELSSNGLGTETETISALRKAENLSNATLTRGNGPRLYVLDNHDHSDPDGDYVQIGDTTVDYTLDVGSLAGFLTFDKNATWQYDYQSAVGAGQFDFYTVMLHEMMHSLGFGSSVSWRTLKSGADWSGPHAIAANGGTGVGLIHEFYNNDPATPDGAHIADGVTSKILGTNTDQAPVMESNLLTGVRKKLTELDIAFLLDLDTPAPTPVDTSTPTPTPTPVPTATPAPVPPSTPAVKGKPPKRTSLAKLTLTGTLATPGAYTVYRLGTKGTFLKAKGGAAWKITLKLKPGKNTIYIASYDPATDMMSTPKKLVITRQ